MALQLFRDTNFRAESLSRISRINEVLSEYDGQKLTARQIYYQFVSRGWLDNNEKSYKTMTNLITDARYAGLVDWEAVEDRGREPWVPADWESINYRVESALYNFRLPRWKGQNFYVELWVEKQALAGVLQPIANRWHIPLMVNKGYSSASAMKDSAERMLTATGIGEVWEDYNKQCEDGKLDEKGVRRIAERIKACTSPVVLYLGDHDPSGEDMVRDIRDRLKEFRVTTIEVEKVALTMAQIKKWNPPPNPAKITDSRAKAYIEKYGDSSWELDALPPRELNRLVEEAIERFVDKRKYNAIVAEEKKQREKLKEALDKIAEE